MSFTGFTANQGSHGPPGPLNFIMPTSMQITPHPVCVQI
jgi:hypothetical protein